MSCAPHRSDHARRLGRRVPGLLPGTVLAAAIATLALGSGGGPVGDAMAEEPLPSRALREWEQRMVNYGRETGDYLASTSDQDKRLAAQYYDAQWVFLRIAQYTGENEPWKGYAEAAEETYKHHLRENDFRIMGYRKFPHGLYTDWKLNGDEQSREHLLKMREQSVFSDPFRETADGWFQQRRSREVAYAIETEILAAKAGASDVSERLRRFVDMAMTHVEIWTSGDYRVSDPDLQFCQSFMAGLTASALISYYEYTVELGDPDERVPAMVQWLADWLWSEMWVGNVNGTGYGAFEYVQPPREGVGAGEPAPDLNMLIAPMYGWLYYRTGEAEYARRGDAIFAGGVALADLGHGKRFNQHYRSSFDYVMWRAAGGAGADGDRPIGPTAAWPPGGR